MADELAAAASQLIAARRELEVRIEAIDAAIAALGLDNGVPFDGRTRKTSVGADKLERVLSYMQEHGAAGERVRQADVHRELNMNSGTTSTALEELRKRGLVERHDKVDRSFTWTLA